MIFIISIKDFKKNAKKLVEPKDYLIIDGTGMSSGPLTKYSRVITLEGFNPPPYLIKAKKDESEDIDSNKYEKVKKKYYKGKEFMVAVMAAVNGFANQGEGQINVFVVLSNKAYKYFGKDLIKRFYKYFNTDYKFVFDIKAAKEDKSLLKKALKSKRVDEVQRILKKYEKKIG